MRTSRTSSIRRTAAVLAAPLLLLSAAASVAPMRAEATTNRRVPTSTDFSVSFSTDSIQVDAGGVASFPVRVRSASRTVPRPVFDVDGVPDYIDVDVDRIGTSTYQLNFYVPANAPSSNGVYQLTATANRRVRTANFRLIVVGRTPITAPPTTRPPAPTAPPQPTIPVTPVTAAPAFGLGIEGPERSGSTGEAVGYPVIVDRSTGYTGPVQFTLNGLPANVQAGFLPNPSNGNTVLYLTPKPGQAAGRFVMSVIATAGSTQKIAAIALTVKVTGDFAMLPTPTSITRTTSGTSTFRLDIAAPTSERPTVSYTVEGLPNGTTAAFSDNNTAAKSLDLNVRVGDGTPSGTYNLVVTGRSGPVVKQVGLQLIVNRPVVAGFSIAANPAAVSIARNGTAQITLTVSPFGNFTGTINTVMTGLPAGVRVASISNATAFSNQPFNLVITLVADSTAPVSSPVRSTITSSSGNTAASVVVTVAVT